MNDRDSGSIEPTEGLFFAVLVAVLMIAQQLAGKALRDGFFLSYFKPEALPPAMVVASLLSVASVLGTAQLFRRIAPSDIVPLVFLGSGLWFLAEWGLTLVAPKVAAASLYIHTTSFGAVVVSGFWSVINERFDPHTAKRVIGKIAGGATLGGVVGGLAAWQGSSFLSIGPMIVVLGVANFACAVAMRRIVGGRSSNRSGTSNPRPGATTSSPSAFAIMEETPYLWQLALLVLTGALGGAAFDYVFKARAAAAFEDSESLVSFFALFYLGLGVSTFAVQQLFAGRALRTVGLTATVATLPLLAVVLGPVAILFPVLWSAVALRAGSAVIESSLYRSGYELLYTPLTPEKKRPTKTLIDVGGDKLGAAVGSGLALVAVNAVPELSETALLILAVACGAFGLSLCRSLHQGYVLALADSLKAGQIDVRSLSVEDRVTRRAVDQTTRALDNARILAELETARGRAKNRQVDLQTGTLARLSADEPLGHALNAEVEDEDLNETLRGIAALRSGRPERIRPVLRWFQPFPRELVPHLLPLLPHPEVGTEVRQTLRRVAPAHTGLLADSLLSAQVDPRVRQHIPSVLERVGTQRSASALVRALSVEDFDLRFRSVVALRRISQLNRNLSIDPESINRAVLRTLQETKAKGLAAGHPSTQAPAGRVLSFSFIALSVNLPPDPLRLALEALADPSPARRGTGLEYLENVLPPPLKDGLHQLLTQPEIAEYAARDERELLRDLEASPSASQIDLETLVARLRETSRPTYPESSL